MRRRIFLERLTTLGICAAGVVGSAGVVVAATPGGDASGRRVRASLPACRNGRIMLDKDMVDAFAACLGDVFEMQVGAGESVRLELIEAVPRGGAAASRPAELRQEPFSLLFRTPAGALHPQRIYTLKHRKLGAMDVFLVPIGPPLPDAVIYEAVFD